VQLDEARHVIGIRSSLSSSLPVCAQIGNLTEEKEELADELESARAVIKRKDQEIQQLRAQNEQMRAQLGGTEVRSKPCMTAAKERPCCE
jgi:prefoldin subunit 5